jgi:XTP/dITP diphosphohydrolase
MKKLILASANKGKIKEIKEIFSDMEVIPYSDILGEFDIPETGTTFKENAIIKAKTIYEKLNDENTIVISDDSGITIKELNNEPNIYSARYAGIDATSEENLQKVINNLKAQNTKSSDAFYTACICVYKKDGCFTTHGFMYGTVIDQAKGNNGFGYDPIFIPEGFDKTLGELNPKVKEGLSHRHKALMLAKYLIK